MDCYEILKALCEPVKFEKEIKLEHLNQDYIIELACKIPEIWRAISLYEEKTITWEQAVYLMIITLTQKKVELQSCVIDLTNRNPRPVIMQSDIKLKGIVDGTYNK